MAIKEKSQPHFSPVVKRAVYESYKIVCKSMCFLNWLTPGILFAGIDPKRGEQCDGAGRLDSFRGE